MPRLPLRPLTTAAPLYQTTSRHREGHCCLIALDIFNTLLRPRIPPAHQYAAVARKYDLPITDETASQTFKAAYKHWNATYPNYGHGSSLTGGAITWWTQVIHQTITRALVIDGVASDDGEAEQLLLAQGHQRGLTQEIFRRFASADAYMLFPDVLPFFERLDKWAATREGQVTVALASNSDEAILLACESLGLDRFVRCDTSAVAESTDLRHERLDAIPTGHDTPKALTGTKMLKATRHSAGLIRGPATLSYEVGHAKPSAEFFRAVLRRNSGAGSTDAAAEAFYVGDDLEEDVMSATRSGLQMTGIWLDREGVGSQQRRASCIRIGSLDELFEHLPQ
ncbi:unnamed protein product [Parajaminaea phylloscopi]